MKRRLVTRDEVRDDGDGFELRKNSSCLYFLHIVKIFASAVIYVL